MAEDLRVVIRTPHEVVFDGAARSVRVNTETGLVGLRPGGEPLVLAVEPGLVLLRQADGDSFAATAGGLLESGRSLCTLLTPVASVGRSEEEMVNQLDKILSTPSTELLARRRLEELEQRIVKELSQQSRAGLKESAHG